MALKDTRGGREYDKFVATDAGDTGIRMITGAHETIAADSGVVEITSAATPGQVVLAATDVTGKERLGIQFFSRVDAINGTFKVWASLETTPSTPIAAADKWTQIGDDISVLATADTGYKAIATTPIKWVCVTGWGASQPVDLQVLLLAD